MKKWIVLSVLFICLLVAGVSAFAYHSIQKPITEQLEEASSFIYSEGLLDEIAAIDFYHGSETYYVAHGLMDGEQTIVWLKEDRESVLSRQVTEGITKEDVKEIIGQELSVAELHSIRLGVEGGYPVYEVTYEDDQQRHSYYYLTFDDGTFMKRYSIRP